MYCRKCGKEILDDSNFCNFCGTRVQLQKEEPVEKALLTLEHTEKTIKDCGNLDDFVLNTELLSISDVEQIRPWVRFWARMIDITVVSMIVGLLVGIFIPHGLGWEQVSIVIRIISAILLESLLLSTWGMTPGKSLLQVYVRDPQGRKLNFSQAIKRSISAWAWGLGFGIPIASLILAYMSYDHLQEKGVVKWDIEGGTLVSHKKIGIPRIAVVVSLFIGFVMLESSILQG
ncbi:MAG TPA: RDD family protein [Desulfosporosinus sp.]